METHVAPRLSDPLSLLKKAWNFYKKHFHDLVSIITITFIAQGFQTVLLFSTHSGDFEHPVSSLYIFGSVLASIIIIFSYFALIIMIVHDRTQSMAIDTSTAYYKSGALIFSYIWIGILSAALTLTGYALFIIPGIAVSVFIMFSLYVLAVEHKKGMKALVQSWYYVQGNWWSVFLRMVVLVIVVLIISIIVGIIVGILHLSSIGPHTLMYVQNVPHSGFYGDVYKTHLNFREVSLVSTFVNQAISSFIITPFSLIYIYLLYTELRVKKIEEVSPVQEKKIRKNLYLVMILGALMCVIIVIALGFLLVKVVETLKIDSPIVASVLSSLQ